MLLLKLGSSALDHLEFGFYNPALFRKNAWAACFSPFLRTMHQSDPGVGDSLSTAIHVTNRYETLISMEIPLRKLYFRIYVSLYLVDPIIPEDLDNFLTSEDDVCFPLLFRRFLMLLIWYSLVRLLISTEEPPNALVPLPEQTVLGHISSRFESWVYDWSMSWDNEGNTKVIFSMQKSQIGGLYMLPLAYTWRCNLGHSKAGLLLFNATAWAVSIVFSLGLLPQGFQHLSTIHPSIFLTLILKVFKCLQYSQRYFLYLVPHSTHATKLRSCHPLGPKIPAVSESDLEAKPTTLKFLLKPTAKYSKWDWD